jgi:murein DD-endopeptidase MepM/ murein hydrolase activator NlpD
LIGCCVKVTLFGTAEPVTASSQSLPTTAPKPVVIDTPRIVIQHVQKNETISRLFEKGGVKKELWPGILSSLQSIYRGGIFEGQEYGVRKAPDSTLLFFTLYSRDRLSEYRITPDPGGGFTADKRPAQLTLKTRTLTGVLSTSLYTAITEAGETPELILNVIDIFSWDINWFIEPRPGDTFKIVCEKYYRDDEFIKYGNILAAVYVNGEHRHAAYYYEPPNLSPGYFDEKGVSLQKSFLKAPLAYRRISSKFTYSRFHPILHCNRPHLGVDYAAPTGTPVKAAGNGLVTALGYKGGYGNCIQVTHPNGYSTYYGHLSAFARGLHRREQVSQGDIIGFVGSTGLSTGPHLDYRVTYRGGFVNPLSLKAIPMRRLPKQTLPAFTALQDSLERVLSGPPQVQYAAAVAK